MSPNWKPSATARKLKRKVERAKTKIDEARNKRQAIRRDHGCRFPRCGCRALKLTIHGAHIKHKGAGGDPKGIRSEVENLFGCCVHRHQNGAVSIHKGTMRPVVLGRFGTNGPMAWLVDSEIVRGIDGRTRRSPMVEVARECVPGVLLDLEPWQEVVLDMLSTMAL